MLLRLSAFTDWTPRRFQLFRYSGQVLLQTVILTLFDQMLAKLLTSEIVKNWNMTGFVVLYRWCYLFVIENQFILLLFNFDREYGI